MKIFLDHKNHSREVIISQHLMFWIIWCLIFLNEINIITIFHSSGFFDPVCQMSNEVEEEISFWHTDHLHQKMISFTSLTVVLTHQTIEIYRNIKPNSCSHFK